MNMLKKFKKNSPLEKSDDDTVATAASHGRKHGDEGLVSIQKKTKTLGACVQMNDFCKLSYYLHCLVSLLSWEEYCAILGKDAKTRAKITDYTNANKLSEKDKDTILRLATEIFSPEAMIGKLILRDPSRLIRGWMTNDFFQVVEVKDDNAITSKVRNTANGVVEVCVEPRISLAGCRPRNLTQVMIYRQVWLNYNYYYPIRNQASRITKLQQSAIPDCIVEAGNVPRGMLPAITE